MDKIKQFMEDNLYEEVIYKNTKGEIIAGCLEDYKINKNKLDVVLNELKITIDNIIKKLIFFLEFGEISIKNDEGIHKFYMI
ncbi:hypothetical protein [Clostridium perfringens]|uniref:hypothetical protein n=1 Tax=Clostridium perfringens TaxID=1502 RepID=UPI0023427B24|nr:hypothetical protein [Clostridium perfringens]MDC4245575.1 hypothetical protein [Clostridium perfringens]